MKYLLTTFLLLLFAQFNVKAQIDVSNQRNTVFEPIQQDNGYTAYQRNVPFEFQFLIDDLYSRVLYNPSYLRSIDSSRIYTTIEPGSNRNYRLSYLSKNGWFLNLSMGNEYNESFSNSNRTSFRADADSNGIFSNLRRVDSELFGQGESENEINRGELKWSKLFKNEEGRYSSLGIYLRYNRSISNRTNNSSSLSTSVYQDFRNDTLTRIRYYEDEVQDFDVNTRNTRKILVGLEHSFINGSRQGYQRLYGQYNATDYLDNNTRVDYSERDEFRPEDNLMFDQIDQLERIYRQEIKYTPWLIGYEAYLNVNTNWLGEDFIFAYIDTYYGENNTDLNFSRIEDRIIIEDDIPESLTNLNIQLDAQDKKEYQFKGYIQLGYALNLKTEDINIFTGLAQSFQYIQNEGYFGNLNYGILEFNDNYHQFSSIIPVFGEYSVNNWLSFFGGATVTFDYNISQRREKLETPLQSENGLNTVSDLNEKLTNQNFQDQTRSYFGVKASHKSGLRLIADVNGDLARLSVWRFTLGYQF